MATAALVPTSAMKPNHAFLLMGHAMVSATETESFVVQTRAFSSTAVEHLTCMIVMDSV